MTSLFGTDGIRGEAGVPPLDAKTIHRVGRALARNLAAGKARRVLIGRDTRSSGSAIESWLAGGIAAGGGEAVSAGVISTPAIANLTPRFGFSAGVVISASHNPFPDNGVKFFSEQGSKADEKLEGAISEEVARGDDDNGDRPSITPSAPDPKLRDEYIGFLRDSLPPGMDLSSLKVALDCANGATYEVGPRLLEELGIELVTMGVSPDGRNINENCGSTHPEGLTRLVMESHCHFGAALDGDGDRLVLVDGDGRLVNGDAILLMCARHMKSEHRLHGPGVVATVMSNLALEQTLATEGIDLYRTKVGDKYVAEEMERRGLTLGGEQSGHIIFSEYSPTGDGLLTLLQVLRVVVGETRPLKDLAYLKPFPQVLVNVPVREKRDVHEVPEIAEAMEEAERRMAGRGRLLVRFSGTEPLLRIMLEGPDEGEIRELSATIAEATRRSLAE
jgi:phosphoglucosamine mutase